MTERAGQLRDLLIRNHETIPKERLKRDPLYDAESARLATGTAASKLGISIDVVAPGKRSCPYHFHYAQEEAFVILEGHGHLRVAGEMLALEPGDTIFIPPGPQYPHQILNTSDAPLRYLSISTRESPEVVEYPDSGKYLAMARGPAPDGPDGTVHVFDHLHRAKDELDYWDGEP